MYKRILLPTDGSEASRRAIEFGVAFARSIGAEVVAMTATREFHTFTTDPDMLKQSRDEYAEASRARGQRLLDEVTVVARDAGVPCTGVQVNSDEPYEAILDTARERLCDLIVMASHGYKGIKGLLMGSVTQKVLVHSLIPVLVHSESHDPGTAAMYKRILVPTDGSPVSEAAVDAALDFARVFGSDIVALGVAVPEPAYQSLEGAMAYDPGLQIDVLLEHARQHVDAVAARAQEAGVSCIPITCEALDAAEAIVDAARQRQCDLIVMGSHGRRGLSRLLAGSVTQAVLARAPVPVMVLRPATDGAGAATHVQRRDRPWPAAGV